MRPKHGMIFLKNLRCEIWEHINGYKKYFQKIWNTFKLTSHVGSITSAKGKGFKGVRRSGDSVATKQYTLTRIGLKTTKVGMVNVQGQRSVVFIMNEDN